MKHLPRFIAAITVLLLAGDLLMSQDFPLRTKFPSVKPISTKDLAAEFGKALIVDVRSDFEYDVIHVKDAVLVMQGQPQFAKQLEEASKGKKDARIVFYCNGQACAKSYHAYEDAAKLGYTNLACYDAGVMEWTETYPDKAVLLGKSPVDKKKLIPKKEFQSRLLDKDAFAKGVKTDEAFLIDIRDPAQKKKLPDFGKIAYPGQLDKLTVSLGEDRFRARALDKTLYIYDAVGKQVEWLQYYLEENGFKKYFFLKDGIRSVLGDD